ncbi:SPOR domain-containing protein [Novosphingobium rosa]|uniref:SPOR domain-containing protein n=1 Tax=Novosphingobium rosa TaxID=76978 RepID=UPI00082BE512|nr:SPOR domain-containing protein [Novosphingobium rosa]
MSGDRQARARQGLGLIGAVSLGCMMGALGAASAMAQSLPVVSHPVVQPLPTGHSQSQVPSNDPARQLSNALGRIANNPSDAEALLDAGNAATALGDTASAEGFYARAEKLAPGNPHALAALAVSKLHGEDPVGAIPMFEQASQGMVLSGDQLADRGLSYDLVGDNASAQRFYREALANGANDETVRRLALSQAIAGDRKSMETTLAPLLQKQDRAAWRTRAFAFAILGREDEAEAIARSTMPPELANGMSPYLRFMRRLTPAQQAAAANLGRFPHASQIGKDDAKIAAYASQHGIRHLAAADAPLAPAGAPLGATAAAKPASTKLAANTRKTRGWKGGAPVDVAPAPAAASNPLPPEPNPSREVSPPPALASAARRPAPVAGLAPAPMANRPDAELPPIGGAAPQPSAALPAATPAPALAMAGEKPHQEASRFDLGRLPPAETTPAPAPVMPGPVASVPPAPGVTAPPPPPVTFVAAEPAAPAHIRTAAKAPGKTPSHKPSFAEAFSEWGSPSARKEVGRKEAAEAPASGAVDIRKIKAPRPAPKAPPPPKYPSRVWVQVGVGRDFKRIAYDWRQMSRDYAKILKGMPAWTADWGRTNRVLVGPFDDQADAKAFEAKLKKAGREGAFMWLSDEGQEVDPL